MRTTLTVLPYLLVMAMAIARSPLDIFQICARGVGTLKLSPWEAAVPRVVRHLRSLFRRLLAYWRASGGLPRWTPAIAAALLLALAWSGHGQASALAVAPIVGSLNLYRQTAADLDKKLAANHERGLEISRDIAAINDAVIAGKRPMTPEEKDKLQSLLGQQDTNATLRAALLREKATNAQLLAEAEADNERQRTAAASTDADAEAARRAAGAAGRVDVGQDRTQLDPKRGFADHREFLSAVMAAGRNPTRIDARLKPLAAAGSDEQGEYSDPHGGFLVPHGVAPGILSIEPEGDPLAELITNVPMTAPTVSYNARVDKNHSTSVSGGFVVTRRPETVDGTSSRMQFEQVTLTANEEFGLAFATERILNDSPASFVAIIAAGFKDEYAANGMNERINGTGAGERQGALNALCKISVAKETGQTAATIVKKNIDKMAARCWRYSQSVWLANHNTRPELKGLVQEVGTGGNAVMYLTGSPGGQEYLDNRPIFFTEFAKTVGTEGDLILLVPSQYLEGTYQSEQYAESIHVRFAAAERCFRFYRRNDGQWWWRSALTPKNGSTLSPVVTLATRS